MENISCDCSVDVDEAYAVGKQEIRTAKKPHECCECHDIITPGTKYEYVTGFNEGQWDVWKTCIPCKSIRDHYCPSGYFFGFLSEHIFECLGFDYRVADNEDDEEKT